MAGRGAGDGGKSVVIGGLALASCAFEERAEAKRSPRRNVERRCRVPLFPGDPGNKPRLLPRCAFRRSASLSHRRERGPLNPPLTQIDLRAAMTLARAAELRDSPPSFSHRRRSMPKTLIWDAAFLRERERDA